MDSVKLAEALQDTLASLGNRKEEVFAIELFAKNQRKLCADAVSKVHTSSRSDPTDTPYVDACLNATGEDYDSR